MHPIRFCHPTEGPPVGFQFFLADILGALNFNLVLALRTVEHTVGAMLVSLTGTQPNNSQMLYITNFFGSASIGITPIMPRDLVLLFTKLQWILSIHLILCTHFF